MRRLRALATPLVPFVVAAAAWLATPAPASAFCGFYVSGSDADLYNNATMVVMMRDGTRTVLSMQNNYEGPPQDFAMVVPVPVVLAEEDVRTLPNEIFDRVDQLAAPRLVEYWEQDPCPEPEYYDEDDYDMQPLSESAPEPRERRSKAPRDLGVTIEAKFEVGEYQILILSAKESGGLEQWLRQEKYNIPKGAAKVLRPYIADGMKFFVAKVDVQKVQTRGEHVMLSPLRFHYDSETFSLPIRLGMLNAKGPQDLIVHILSREVRYAVANYGNRSIPTNLDVTDATREHFGAFYASLFDSVLEAYPRSVVTEYAWQAGSCDPCPTPPLSMEELATLGADALPTYERAFQGRLPSDAQYTIPSDFVLTRLHARYDSSNLGEDLVFRAAGPIAGGREFIGADGKLEQGVVESSHNNFQARYAIRHRWTGPVDCENPQFGIWGGPTEGAHGSSSPAVARDLAFAPRTDDFDNYLTQPVAEFSGAAAAHELRHGDVSAPDPQPIKGMRGGGKRTGNDGAGCAGCQGDSNPPMASLGAFLVLLGMGRRRRKRSHES